jgi:Tol biopolymer transport system component
VKNLKVILFSLLALTAITSVGCGGGDTTFKKLPFASNRTSSTTSLFVMNLDGTNVSPVNNVGNNFWAPSISANFKKVVYMSNNNVWAINADGTGNTQLTTYTDDQADGNSYSYYARISPNGKTVLYSVWDGNAESDNIWSMNIDGSNKKNLTATMPAGMSGCYRASYSADEKKIAFSCYDQSSYSVWVANADGSHQSQVVPPTTQVFFDIPMFSPDGKKVLFMGFNFTVGGAVRGHAAKLALSSRPRSQFHVAPRGNSNNQGVFSFNLDGSNGTLLVPGTWEFVMLNSSLYYSVYDSDISHDQIWKSNADGTGAVKLSDGTADDWLDISGD